MRSMLTKASAASAVLALVIAMAGGSTAHAEGWGTVKGQVTYDGTPPENPKVAVQVDVKVCLAKGDIRRDEWVVDPKSKGVKWALVWLTEVKNTDGAKTAWDEKKIHPKRKPVPDEVVIDQPICTFVPRMTAMRKGSKLIVKNSATVSHNVNIAGGPLGPNINQVIVPGGAIDAGKPAARRLPFSYACNIHPWMKGWIAVFEHPYFAVTNDKGEFVLDNAPAGKYRLMVWHEGAGFIQKNAKDRGLVIEIGDKKTTEVLAKELKIKAD